jgi:hypothetical protein
VQRSEPGLGVGFQIRVRLNQRLHNTRVLFRRGPHQCGLILSRLFGIHVGAMNQQHPNRFDTAGVGARHQRRLTGPDWGVGFCAGFQQQVDQCRASVRAGSRKRGHPQIVRRVGIGAGPEQQLRSADIVPMRRPQECRRAVCGSDVYVRIPLEQRSRLLRVLAFCSFDQPEVVASGGRADNHEQRERTRPKDALPIAVV